MPWSAAAAQEWRFEWRSSGYALRSRSDPSLCLDVGTDGLLVERACADARGTGDPLAGQRWLVE